MYLDVPEAIGGTAVPFKARLAVAFVKGHFNKGRFPST